MWSFDLAIDVLALLAGLPGLSAVTRFRATQALRDLDRNVHGHTWKKALKQAGEGPSEFRGLRGWIPPPYSRARPDPSY